MKSHTYFTISSTANCVILDVWAAFNSGKATLIPTDSWVDNVSISSVSANGDLDDYCNLAILIFAEIVNLLSGAREAEGGTTNTSFEDSVRSLWKDMQTWYLLRPREVRPLLRHTEPSKIFPEVVYTRYSPSKPLFHQWSVTSDLIDCGHTFYHAGCMLLLQHHLVMQDPSFESMSAEGNIVC